MSTDDVLKQCHDRMYGGANYTHAEDQAYDLTDIQIQILKELVYKYPAEMFKPTKVQTMVKNTFGIKCSECGSENIYVKSVQLRSADEATSKIYTCIDCKHIWRVG